MGGSEQRILVGIDTGGTFTDFVVWDGEELRVHKVLSTPRAPERAILTGLQQLGLIDAAGLRIRHGTTVATNAVLEGKGVRTAYVTNRGLGDLLTIGRQNRAELYTLSPRPLPPPVPDELIFEVGGRIGADGEVLEELSDQELERLPAELDAAGARAVAINLLHAYLDDRFERRIADALRSELFVSRSAAVLAEIGEYERGIATWINAYIGPLVADYLERLAAALPRARIAVMQSNGLTVGAAQAGSRAAQLLLSGPAGGVAGALALGRAAGQSRLMTLDVGGTSTDVALLDGRIGMTRGGRIGRFPVAVPMVDLHTIGAGGGSIARIDPHGLLHVGPESAGAEPGPACYGRGGELPTVTDAMLILGRLPDGAGLGRDLVLDSSPAREALGDLATALGGVEQAAAGIVRLANEQMAAALRVISVERGHDPKEFTLCAFGGAGGLHACEVATLLGINTVLIPAHAGVLSALGMLYSPPGREATRTLLGPLEGRDPDIEGALGALADALTEELVAEGVPAAEVKIERLADVRYRGQSTTLTVAWRGGAASANAFHGAHLTRYGHALDHPVELVSLRIRASATPPAISLARTATATDPAPDSGPIRRSRLAPGQRLAGPATILDSVGTCWVAPGWEASCDEVGNLILTEASMGSEPSLLRKSGLTPGGG